MIFFFFIFSIFLFFQYLWAARPVCRCKYLGPQLICQWAESQSYLWGSNLDMVILPQALSSHQFPYFFPLFPSFSLITHLPQFFQPSELWPRPPFIPLCEWDGHHFYSHSLTYSHISQDPKGSSRIQRIPLELVPDASYGSMVDFFIVIGSQLPASFRPRTEFLHDCL